jgi:hypothetical protein
VPYERNHKTSNFSLILPLKSISDISNPRGCRLRTSLNRVVTCLEKQIERVQAEIRRLQSTDRNWLWGSDPPSLVTRFHALRNVEIASHAKKNAGPWDFGHVISEGGVAIGLGGCGILRPISILISSATLSGGPHLAIALASNDRRLKW